MFVHKDPRRYATLVDYLFKEFEATDYNGESSLSAVKALAFFRAFYEEACWKFSAWTEDVVSRVWGEMASEHDDVRIYISDLLTFTDRVKVRLVTDIASLERRCEALNHSGRRAPACRVQRSSCASAGRSPLTGM
jgi:proteasome activator subunit 4